MSIGSSGDGALETLYQEVHTTTITISSGTAGGTTTHVTIITANVSGPYVPSSLQNSGLSSTSTAITNVAGAKAAEWMTISKLLNAHLGVVAVLLFGFILLR